MPRKAAVSKEPETPAVLTPFEDSNVAYDVAKDVVDDIIERGGDELYEHYLQTKEIVLAAKITVEEMNNIIRSAFLIRDAGEAGNESAWAEDHEPTPANTDSWARGAVPSKKKKKSAFLGDFKNGEGGSGSVFSGGSRSRRWTRSSKGRKSSVREKDNDNDPPTIITRAATPSKSLKALSDKNTAPQQTSEQVLEFEEQARAERLRLETLRKKRHDEDQLFLSYKEREDLLDKEYTFSANGELIVMSAPDRSKLPGYGIQLGKTFQLDNDTPEPEPQPEPDVNPESAPGKKRKKRRRSKKRRASVAENNEFFSEDISRQPPLITTIRLAAGVSLKEGNQEKKGTNQLEDPLHMSRADFKEHQLTLEEQPKAKSQEDAYTMDSGQISNIDYEEFDLTSGARRRDANSAVETPEFYDPNQELISSADWGSSNPNPHAYSPPLRPARVKDVLKRYETTVGRITQKPRDRPYSRQSTEPEPEKLVLPAISASREALKLQEDPSYSKARYKQTFGSKNAGNMNVTNKQALVDIFGASVSDRM